MGDADNPPSLGNGLSPSRRLQEALPESFLVLPCRQRIIKASPLDEHLVQRAVAARVQTTLQYLLGDLKNIIGVWQLGTDSSIRRSRFKQGHVKYRMYGRRWWEVQLVGDGPDFINNLERPEVLETQFVMRPRGQGRLNVWLQPKINTVPNTELPI